MVFSKTGLDENMTLKQFAESYSEHLEHHVQKSHNFRSPKIDANYDDYEYKNVNPITSQIFYYFFSAGRVSRGLSGMLLAAARYPNEKIRRAYLRFWAQGI